MFVKAVSKPTGIPRARVAVSPGVTPMGAPQVTQNISALDEYDMPTVVASLRLSPADARLLAARLIEDAATADYLAAQEGGK